ncbi:hypothetical protein MNB_ARC-1_92 [hydrothermal vent metagenome]|uniref:AB hydrolase-1 domain-containing protein n=1 Tax=hydrothermal vent metagenome TaxID=652676 RepID=A0A3B1E1V7_9ZZZZ
MEIKTYYKDVAKHSFLFLVVFGLFMTGCNNNVNRKSADHSVYINKVFSNFEYRGNWDSDTVLICSQGGPVFYLEPEQFPHKPLLNAPLEELKNSLVVYVHQYQTKYRHLFVTRDISFEEAKKFDKKTIDMLAKTIDFFHNKGKKVYLVGSSFGAFVVQDYLAKYGSDKLTGTIIAVGRLAMQEAFWKGFSKGDELFFKNGTQIVHDSSKEENSSDPYSYKNSLKLAGALGSKNYIKLLRNVDLHNTMYIYGENDSYVGRLTQKEVKFLKSKGVHVAKSKGGHQKAVNQFMWQALLRIIKNE